MKKGILIFSIGLTMLSCSKEPSSCGRIVSDNVHEYSITIRNSNTNNLKTFYLTEGDWMNAHPGDNYCITNTTQW
jgi:hypothetical protein